MLEVQKARIPSKYRYFVNGEWIEEDDMVESPRQSILANFLVSVIRLLFRYEQSLILDNVYVYPLGQYSERVAPDILIVKGVSFTDQEIDAMGSWEIDPPEYPVPNVAIEISSASTWTLDVQQEYKPTDYAELGIPEYFAFDPKGVWINFDTKLQGWRTVNGQPVQIQPNENGWLWSEELRSWLVSDGSYLHLHDEEGNRRLSEGEAHSLEEERRYLAEEQAERERIAREEAEYRAKYERQAHEEVERKAEQSRLEAENRIADLERQMVELQAKLKAQEGQ